jgi:hypothetical protein
MENKENFIETFYNHETGETIVREITDEEYAHYLLIIENASEPLGELGD